ncbi:hypothetical protein J6590_024366 [Homalodisca vitripennis]|nr:hypothetical protein J6590_024360 [Homalodisca vitripennis]KAG8337376.1 hypothetical protein J6590_024366 [Homalodisca vitripennis]
MYRARPCSLALCHVNHVLSITVQLWLTVLWWRHMYSCQTLQFGFVPCQPCSEYYSATVAHSTVVAPYVFMLDPAAWLCHVNHVHPVLWWRHMYSCQTLQFGFVPCQPCSEYYPVQLWLSVLWWRHVFMPDPAAWLCHTNHVLSITVQLWLTVLWWRHMYSCQTLQFGFVPCQPCSEYYCATVAHSTVVAPYVFMPDPAVWLCAMSTMF